MPKIYDNIECCRLLVGMQKLTLDILKESFSRSDDHMIDQAEMLQLKKKLAYEFKEQLNTYRFSSVSMGKELDSDH